MNEITTTLSPAEFENLIRRVVRQELARLLRASARSRLEDVKHEGPNEPAEDETLLREALDTIQKYGDKPEAWMSWEAFESELDRAETAGELPD
ncbi:MAG TPA: hypothetical protein VJG32_07590 [Anaerolineae bacterium]|nr:hypothetical protein [Anaerolineae bacterium]